MKIEHIRDATNSKAMPIASLDMRIIDRPLRFLHVEIIIVRYPDKNTARAARYHINRLPGMLQCLPADLQQQSVLRIDMHRLSWRDTKERSVKVANPIEETTPAGCHLTGYIGARIKIRIGIPAI